MKKTLIAVIGLAASLAGVQGQVQLTTSYSQDFNSFGTSNVTWTNNSTLPGWTITAEVANPVGNLVAGNGSATAGTIYNYGSTGDSNRSLGYIGSGSNDWSNFYLTIQNNTGFLLNEISLSYSGRLWRSGGAQPSHSVNTLSFYYSVGSPTLVNSISTTGWTNVSSLNYAPVVNVVAGPISGAAAALSSTISGLNLNNGDTVVLRWLGNNGAGNDAGLAIDDVVVTAVPEPSTWALIGLGSAFVLWRLRRKTVV
jgi:hypothetical protein